MSRIRISNQFLCLFGIRCALANLQGIHPVEVKWILSRRYKIGDVKLENPSEKYLLLQPASTIPMGSTYGICTNMVSLKIKSTRWFDVTLFYIPIGGHQQPLSSGHVNSPSQKGSRIESHGSIVFFPPLATYNGILGRLLNDVINILNCTWPPQAPPPFIHKNDVTFKNQQCPQVDREGAGGDKWEPWWPDLF